MSDSPRRPVSRASLGWLFAVALLLRLVVLVAADTPGEAAGRTPWEWGGEAPTLAAALAEGRGYGDPWGHDTGPSSWLTPPYPWLVAQAMRLGGGVTPTTAWILFALQSLVSAWTCVLIAQLGRRLGQAPAGLLGGWLFAIYPVALWNATGVVWDTTLVACGVTLFLNVLLARGPAPRGAVLSGLCFGGLLFLNPAPVSLVPAVLAWLFLQRGRRAWTSAAAFLAAAVLVCLPWMLRNQRELGTLQLRPNFGAELRMGNHDGAHGRPVPWRTHPSHVEAELASYRELGEAGYGRANLRRALDWIRAHPRAFMGLSVHRVQLFWVGQLPGADPRRSGNVDPGADPASWLKFLVFGLTGAGALVALFWVELRRPDRILLIGTLMMFGLPYYLTYVSERYRFPVDPVILLLDGWLILRLVRPALARHISPGGIS